MAVKKPRRLPSTQIIAFLDATFDPRGFPDDPRAQNGLQVSPPSEITKVATAVDACATTLEKALQSGAQLLLVHHGLLWESNLPWVEERYRILRILGEGRFGVYSLHLPLDAHPRLGNNILLARRLRLKNLTPFGSYKGKTIGWLGTLPPRISRGWAEERLGFSLKEPVPPRALRKIAIVSGNARGFVREAHACGADLMLTGEVDHHALVLARDLGLGLWLGGHYHTETLGVQAVGELLRKRFGVEHEFLPDPVEI